MAGTDALGPIEDPGASKDETLVDMAVVAVRCALASAGRDVSEIDTVIGVSSSDNDAFPIIAEPGATASDQAFQYLERRHWGRPPPGWTPVLLSLCS